MTSMSDTRPVPVGIDRRSVGVIAGMSAGPLFLTVAGLLTWAELDYLHGLGWHYTKDNPVPWPSATALGPYGWVQILNFALTGGLLLAFVHSFRSVLQGRTGRIATVLLYVMGIALLVSAFPTDHASTQGHSPNTWHGVLHSIGFVCIAIPSVIVPIVVAVALRQKPGWRTVVVVSAAVPLVEILFFIPAAAAWHDAGFTGYLATLFGWFAFLAFRLRRESHGVTVP
jgi:Protein of unknown function (DUF998)